MPNVDPQILKLIIEYSIKHDFNPLFTTSKPILSNDLKTNLGNDIDYELLK